MMFDMKTMMNFAELTKYEQRIINVLSIGVFHGRFMDLCKKIGSSKNCTPAVHKSCIRLRDMGIIEINYYETSGNLESIRLTIDWVENLNRRKKHVEL